MDFHSMKRKELQALCKKHKIPANLSNLEMASRLSELHKENEKSLTQGPVGTARETESTDVVVNDRKVKKVRFNPEHELVEFTRSRPFRRGTRRNSVGKGSLSVEDTCDGELGKGDEDSPSRVMQLRVKRLVVAVANVSKRGRKEAKGDDDTGERKALGNEDDHELVERIGESPGRITRSRKQNVVEASMQKEKRGRKVVRSKDIEALVSAGNDDDRVVTRRSNRNRGVVNEGKLCSDSNKDVKDNGKGLGDALEDKKIEGSHVMVEPQILVRRSKRVADSLLVNDDMKKHEDNGVKGLRRAPKLLAAKCSRVDEESTVSNSDLDGKLEVALEQPIKQELRRSYRRKSMMVSQEKVGVDEESTVSETDPDGKLEVVLELVKPIEQELRRSNRRKSMMVSREKVGNVELKSENEDKRVLRSSLSQSGAAGVVSKDEKKVTQLVGGTRRTRRKTSSLKLDEKLDIDVSAENFETAAHSSELCPVEEGSLPVNKNTIKSKRNISKDKPLDTLDERHEDSAIQQKNQSRKRNRGSISGGDVIKSNYDPSSSRRSERRPSKINKTGEAVVVDKVADERNSPVRSEKQNPSHAALREGFQAIGKSLSVDAELSVSEVAESASNPGSTSKTSAINISNDVHGKTSRNEQDASIADHGGSTDMKLISSNELGDIEETAHSRSAEFKMGYADCEKELSASKLSNVEKVHSSLESDMQEIVEKRSPGTDKKEPEPLMFNETGDSSMREKIDYQVLPKDLDVLDEAGTSSSANTLLLQAQADKYAEPSSDVVDHVGEVEGVSDLEYSGDIQYTGSKGSIHLYEPSSGKLWKSVEGDNIAGGDRRTVSRLAETDEDGCLKDNGNDDGDTVYSLSYLFDRDSCDRITPQDRGIYSGQYSAGDPAEGEVSKDFLVVPTGEKSTKTKQKSGPEDSAEKDEAHVDENIPLKFSDAEKSGSSNDQKSKCGEDKGFSVTNLFDAERKAWTPAEDKVIFSDENAINDSDEQRVLDDFPAVTPVSMCRNSEIKQRSGHGDDQIAERQETYVHNDIHFESADICESGCLKDQKCSKDEDWEFCLSNLFDGDGSVRSDPQDKGVFAAEYVIEDSDEPGMSFNSPARSTMCMNDSEVKFNAGSSSSPDPVPCNTSSVSKYQETIEEKEAVFKTEVPEDGMSMENMTRDGENEIFNPADKHKNKDTNEPAEPNIIQGQEAWNNGRQMAGNAMSTQKIDGKGETNQTVRECDKFEDGVAMSEESTLSKVRSESNDNAEPTMNSASDRTPTYMVSSQSWTEVELINHFGTTEDNAFPTGLNEINSQGTELACLTMSVKESIASSGGSLTKMRKKEMLEETGSECEKSINEVWSIAGDKAENAMSFFETNNKGKGNQVAQGPNIDEDVNDENCGKDKEDFVDACTLDVALSRDYTISNIGVESTNKDLLATDTVLDVDQESAAKSSQSWTDMGLKNLFGTMETNVIAAGVDDTSSQGTEVAIPTMTMYTSKASSCGSLTKMKKKEEGEAGNECKKSANKDVVLPTNYRAVSDADTEDDGLKMFATPINIVAPNKVGETSAHGGKLDSAVFYPESVGTKKENVVTQVKSGEKVGHSGNDLENNFCPEISLSANGKDTSKELKEVESVQLVNPGTITVLSGSEFEGCEASGEQQTENTCEGVVETVKIMEESKDEKIISPGLSSFDGCDASGEQQTENTCEGVEETVKIMEESKDEMIMSSGLSSFDGCEASGEEQTENTCEGVEETVNIMEESKDEMITSPGLSSSDGCEASGEQQTEYTCEGMEETVKIMEESKDEMIMSPGLSSFDGCEASGEHQTQNTCEDVEETVKIMEESKDEKIMSPGQSSFDDEAAQNGNERTDMQNTMSTGSLRSSKKFIECDDMLIDTELMKDLSCSSERKMVHNSEAAFGVSDGDFQKSAVLEDINLFTACCEDDKNVREALANTSGGPVDSEIAKISSSGQKDVTHKGTPSCSLAKSYVDIDEVAEKKCEKSIRVGGDSCGPKVCDKIDDNLVSAYELNELLNSKKVTDPERHSVCYNVQNRVPPAEHGTPVYDAETEMLGDLAMLFGDNGRSDMEKRESLSLESDHEKNGKEVVENLTPKISTQFSMQELHLEENTVNFNKDVSTVSIEPTSVCNEILKESDVADTIKEYMDSESSMSVDFDDSDAPRPMDVLAQTDERTTDEDDVLEEAQADTDGIPADSEGKLDETLVETASKQEEAMVFTEPAVERKKTEQPPFSALIVNEGSTADDDKIPSVCSEGKELEDAKKNVRIILIHGTPKKSVSVADMKENAPMSKSSQNGDFTAFRPAKRRALQDVQWK